jgi:hypothetical protein
MEAFDSTSPIPVDKERAQRFFFIKDSLQSMKIALQDLTLMLDCANSDDVKDKFNGIKDSLSDLLNVTEEIQRSSEWDILETKERGNFSRILEKISYIKTNQACFSDQKQYTNIATEFFIYTIFKLISQLSPRDAILLMAYIKKELKLYNGLLEYSKGSSVLNRESIRYLIQTLYDFQNQSKGGYGIFLNLVQSNFFLLIKRILPTVKMQHDFFLAAFFLAIDLREYENSLPKSFNLELTDEILDPNIFVDNEKLFKYFDFDIKNFKRYKPLFLLAKLKLEEGDIKTACHLFQKLFEGSMDKEIGFYYVKSLIKIKQYDAAFSTVNFILWKFPNNPKALLLRAILYFNLTKIEKARLDANAARTYFDEIKEQEFTSNEDVPQFNLSIKDVDALDKYCTESLKKYSKYSSVGRPEAYSDDIKEAIASIMKLIRSMNNSLESSSLYNLANAILKSIQNQLIIESSILLNPGFLQPAINVDYLSSSEQKETSNEKLLLPAFSSLGVIFDEVNNLLGGIMKNSKPDELVLKPYLEIIVYYNFITDIKMREFFVKCVQDDFISCKDFSLDKTLLLELLKQFDRHAYENGLLVTSKTEEEPSNRCVIQ